MARRAARILDAADVPVESVAARLGVTSRHPRRAFYENVGISPKEFARSARLHPHARVHGDELFLVALAAGYYDQARLNAEFRDLVGLSQSRSRGGRVRRGAAG